MSGLKTKQRDPVIDVGRLFGELPPRDLHAEMSTLGSIMLSPGEIANIEAAGITAEMFYKPAHSVIYEAVSSLQAEGTPVDVVTLTRRLSDRKMLDQVGGVEYLVDLFNSVPGSSSASYYAEQVVESYRKRKIIDLAGKMLHRAYNETIDDAKAQAWSACAELESIGTGQREARVTTRQEASRAAYAELEKKYRDGYIRGLRTGFDNFDEDVAGLKGGNLYILAARPGMGKTAWSLQIANHVANSGTPVLFASIEMPPEQIAARDLAYSSGLSLHQVRDPRFYMGENEWEMVRRTMASDRGELLIYDAVGAPAIAIEAVAKRCKATHGVGLIVIDFLQLMANPAGVEKKYEAVGGNAKACKQMSRRLDVPVLLLSQLSRTVERRDGRRPMMSDLRDSGEIEEAADVVAMLHREDYHRLNADPNAELDHIAEVIIGKNRHGPTGVVELRFAGGSFSNHEHVA